MKLVYSIIAFSLVCGLLPSLASAQAALDRTTLGKQQNDARELVNSLVPGETKYGKGEKKEQVNAGQLKSKSIKDTTFGGSLLNMGIDPSEPKLEEQKLHSAPTEKDSTAVKPAALNEKDPAVLQLADPAALALSESRQSDAGSAKDKAAKSSDANSDGHKNEQKAADKEKDKASANKSDGGH
jgi:hypothetical protein